MRVPCMMAAQRQRCQENSAWFYNPPCQVYHSNLSHKLNHCCLQSLAVATTTTELASCPCPAPNPQALQPFIVTAQCNPSELLHISAPGCSLLKLPLLLRAKLRALRGRSVSCLGASAAPFIWTESCQ